jgi:hypothetical protein
MKKRYWLLIIISAIGLLYYGYHYWKYTPRPNPHPQYFMTVTGKVDPSLVGKIHLRWQVQYYTTKPSCETAGSAWIEGAYAARIKNLIYPINISPSGQIKTKIPLDALLPGYCGWAPSSVEYQLPQRQTIAFISLHNNKHEQDTAMSKIACKLQPKLSCWAVLSKDYADNLEVKLRNLYYTIDILRSSHD